MIGKSSLIDMKVYHKRYRPRVYEFSHKVLYFLFKLNNTSSPNSRLFSLNKLNFFSLFWRDYGFEKFDDPALYIKQILQKFNIKSADSDDLFLLTMPKVVGFGFNPVSFWLCFDSNQSLYAVLAEVNNTFGERHGYLCFNQNMEPITKFSTINCQKVFHVSPFCKIEGNYEFKFKISSGEVKINIDYFESEKKLISTSINGKFEELVDKNLIRYFFLIPFMTIKVIALIHYHALRIWLKKIPYITKPKKTDIDITSRSN